MDLFQFFAALFSLCLLIFVHELGHFLLAKYNRVGVLAFAIGFGPILLKKKIGETTYSLRAFPLGGFVRMVGDDPREVESLASRGELLPNRFEDEPEEDSEPKQELTPEEQRIVLDPSRWFLKKGFWAKSAIVFAGPAFNIVFAILLSIFTIYIFGDSEPVDKPIIGDILPGGAADRAGLRANDYVASIDSIPMQTWEQLAQTVRKSQGKEMSFEVLRNVNESKNPIEGLQSEEIKLSVVAEVDESALVSKEEKENGDVYRIGIRAAVDRVSVPFVDAVIGGHRYVWFLTKLTVSGLAGIFTGSVSADNIAGPIRIIQEAGKSAERGGDSLLRFMIVLSVSLGLLNLLPVPVLDGGHLFFFIIEAVKGSPLSLKVREISNQVGIALLLALMLFAVGNDIWGTLR